MTGSILRSEQPERAPGAAPDTTNSAAVLQTHSASGQLERRFRGTDVCPSLRCDRLDAWTVSPAHCAASAAHSLDTSVVDLGMSPLCESFLTARTARADGALLSAPRARLCTAAGSSSSRSSSPPEDIFTEYAYFSAYSTSWVEHARDYVEMIRERLEPRADDLVVELASNDGYLLQHFVGTGIPVLGHRSRRERGAEAAEARGVPTLVEFFGRATARRLVAEGRQRRASIVGNNVLAQVPDLNDFVAGVAILLAPDGTATFEFPHLLAAARRSRSTTRSTTSTSRTSRFATIEDDPRARTGSRSTTSRSSRRTAARCASTPSTQAGRTPVGDAVRELLEREEARGCARPERYAALRRGRQGVEARAARAADPAPARRAAQVVGYGAPGKGNTLLNYCGIRTDLLDYTVDRNPYKQRPLHARDAHPDPSASSGSPRRARTTSSSCRGT